MFMLIKSPGMTATIDFNFIQVLFGLAFLSVVNKALLLVVRKLLEAFEVEMD